MRAALESLLRARKLDVTLTATPEAPPVPAERLAPIDRADVDTALGGGLRRGHLSEITGGPSSGRTTVAVHAMAAAAARGEAVALVDTCDLFDPVSAAGRGLLLPRLLWVRPSTPGAGPSTRPGTGDESVSRALKAFCLILQAGGFGLVVLDLADVPAPALRRFPLTTWMRVARIVEGSDTVALLVGREHIARSAGGVTIALEASAPSGVEGSPSRWRGGAHRARIFTGLHATPRVIGGRRTNTMGECVGGSGAKPPNW